MQWLFNKSFLRTFGQVIVSLILISLFAGFIYFCSSFNWNEIFNDLGHFFEIIYALILLSTLGVAYWKLDQIRRTNHAELLVKIEIRYGSNEILKARKLIHQIHIESKDPQNPCEDHYLARMRTKIKEKGEMREDSQEFILLKNFLEFLESISYYQSKGYLSENDVHEMFGHSIPYWYKVYKDWIYYLRGKLESSNAYLEFENLAKRIEKDDTDSQGS